MPLHLFVHNRQAYEQALTMMAQTGKAAVIHPTGTGKSFIGFQLCADYPDKRICWLSPSEYIFKTQLENLKAAAGGYIPENVTFYTYAKLMLMSPADMEKIQPDYIILDEFHRCGAQMWGAGVQMLLEQYPQVPLLGLTATNIRYLDNQRDMADELFDGNVASQMSLGEAIVRGILNPPKYVLSAFSYQKDLEKYQKRIRSVRSKAARDESEKYLEALRRALEKADGLEDVFYKHIADPSGKYIVFCANKEHMDEMISLAPQWFYKVDESPSIYSAYSEDPETDRAFAAFKADTSSHLKLLYCIDMLNEGIHVEDVDGVILLRPTISPIIYKQQIGRALSAGKKKDAVIFDIVLNIENLYSIGAIEEEMQAAITYYRSLGMDYEIVNEQFRIVDEVRDCMELFDKLNGSLTASWELMYHYAQNYVKENGDLEVPKRYVTGEGYSLGAWIQTQRLVRAGKTSGILTDVQVKLLDDIGMRWENARDIAWEKYYAAAKQYYEEHGDLLISMNDSKCGLALGRWIAQLRNYRKSNIQSAYISPERIAAMDAIGMVWDVPDYLWERNFASALEYRRQHGNLEVPADYVDENGVRLGVWLSNVRTGVKKGNARKPLTADQIRRLDELGMNWEGKYSATWDRSYAAACQYKKEHGNLQIPASYTTKDGIALGRWIRRQKAEKLTEARKAKLDAIGMVWEKEDPWMEKFRLVKAYYDQNGHTKMPADYVVDGVWLRRWLSEQTARLNERSTESGKTVKKLTEKQTELLASVGIRPLKQQLLSHQSGSREQEALRSVGV